MKNKAIYNVVRLLKALMSYLIKNDDDYQSWCELVEPRLDYLEYKKYSAKSIELIEKHDGDYCKAYYAEPEMERLENLLA